jgi:hypothetical protein
MAQLDAAMAAQLGQDPAAVTDPAQGAADPAAIPEAFRPALEISPFVTSPEGVQQAVRAADEVWKVATGQLPARTMLENFKTTNPQQYQAIVQDLSSYIQETTGQSLTGAASPLDGLKTSHPQVFSAIQQFVKQNAGVDIGGEADPRDERLSAIERTFAAEQEARQVAAWNEKVATARTKAIDLLSSKTKGTFAEGQETYLLQLCGAKSGIPEQQMIDMILQGKTEKLEAAYQSVVKEEVARLKTYNANLIKRHRTLASAVPAAGAQASKAAPGKGKEMPIVPGESLAQRAERAQREGWLTE